MTILDVIEAKKKLKTIVYVDYDNVLERFSALGVTINQVTFFETIKAKLTEEGLYVCDIVAYANFEKSELFNVSHQTQLRHKGILTKHCSSDGKNSGDLEMTVDVLVDLYKEPTVDAFVIVSNDRDFIPLLRAVKKEDKMAILSCSEKGINKTIANYADFVLYFETIFTFPEKSLIEGTSIEKAGKINVDAISDEDRSKAQTVVEMLYKSNFWRTYEKDNSSPVKLQGYAILVAKHINELKDDVIRYFEIAHSIGMIELFIDPATEQVCIKSA
ncbi:NYN domain-containing protein [Psychrobacillus sp. FJAT-51614]|uniref:NYN domain-containing protein n=1 Tax=Psychrobacillus mangrovi TaxID=3117745 RepID=A0ABU8F7D4_9BACI